MTPPTSPNYEAALRKLAQGLVSQARPDLDPTAAEHVRWTARLVEAALVDVASTTVVGADLCPTTEGAMAHEAGSFASLQPDPDFCQAVCGGTDGIALQETKPPQTWGLGLARGPRSASPLGPELPAEGDDRGKPQPPPARG